MPMCDWSSDVCSSDLKNALLSSRFVCEILTHQEMAPSWVSTHKNIHAKDKPAQPICPAPPQPAAFPSDLLRPSPKPSFEVILMVGGIGDRRRRGQSTGVSALASVLPKKSQGWSPSEWTGWISLQSKGLSGVFSDTTVQKHQFFSAQPSSHLGQHFANAWIYHLNHKPFENNSVH